MEYYSIFDYLMNNKSYLIYSLNPKGLDGCCISLDYVYIFFVEYV